MPSVPATAQCLATKCTDGSKRLSSAELIRNIHRWDCRDLTCPYSRNFSIGDRETVNCGCELFNEGSENRQSKGHSEMSRWVQTKENHVHKVMFPMYCSRRFVWTRGYWDSHELSRGLSKVLWPRAVNQWNASTWLFQHWFQFWCFEASLSVNTVGC
jgi:hypothetical protein